MGPHRAAARFIRAFTAWHQSAEDYLERSIEQLSKSGRTIDEGEAQRFVDRIEQAPPAIRNSVRLCLKTSVLRPASRPALNLSPGAHAILIRALSKSDS
jgi:hypothetical protein